jgi:DNA-binding transcriptional regulator YhcF (GntR family)
MTTPKYRQLVEVLRTRIRKGEYAPGAKLPGHLVLAREFGVSAITSNRALVELEREGFIVRRPRSGSFVSDRAGALNEVLVVLRGPLTEENVMLFEYWRGVTAAAESAGVTVRTLQPSDRALATCVKSGWRPGLGIVFAICALADELAGAFAQSAIPHVYLDMEPPRSGCRVEADRYGACRELVRTLMADGCGRIGFVGNLNARTHALARDGYLDAVAPLGLPGGLVRDANDTTVTAVARELLNTPLGLDALVVMGGHLPVAALPVILGAPRKPRLGVLTENRTVLQLRDVAYVGWYSQVEAGRLAFQLLRQLAAGQTLGATMLHPPFRILRPGEALDV